MDQLGTLLIIWNVSHLMEVWGSSADCKRDDLKRRHLLFVFVPYESFTSPPERDWVNWINSCCFRSCLPSFQQNGVRFVELPEALCDEMWGSQQLRGVSLHGWLPCLSSSELNLRWKSVVKGSPPHCVWALRASPRRLRGSSEGFAWNLISFQLFPHRFILFLWSFRVHLCVRLQLTSAGAQSSSTFPSGGRRRAARVSMAAAPFLQRAQMPCVKGDLFGWRYERLSSTVWSAEDEGEKPARLILFNCVNPRRRSGARKLLKLRCDAHRAGGQMWVVMRESMQIRLRIWFILIYLCHAMFPRGLM